MTGSLVLALAMVAADPKLIPDPTYNPKVGDIAIVGFFVKEEGRTLAANGFLSDITYDAYWTAIQEDDEERIDRLRKGREIREIVAGSRVRIVQLEAYSLRDAKADSALVVPLEGRYRGQKLWIAQYELLRKVVAEARGQPDPRPSTMLKAAQNLEKIDKKAGALDFYVRIAREYPGSTEAKTAIVRIKALGGKIPAPQPAKERKPTTPARVSPPRKKRRYASQEAARQEVEMMLGDMLNRSLTSHLCGFTTRDGHACQRVVTGPGFCYQHRGY